MRRLCLSIILAVILLCSFTLPAFAASISIQGIYYNFNAAENEWALKVQWTGKPAFEIKANEFYLQKVKGQLETITQVEERIQDKFNDLLVVDTKLTTIDADDPVRQDPPILVWPDTEIVIINNSEYLRTHKAFFRIHIYSLDDLETPDSELRFVTRFSKYPIEDEWWPE